MQDKRLIPIAYVVDDDDIMLDLLSGLIASIKAEVKSFRSAREFLTAFAIAPCQCVISDIRMPEIGGLQMQAELLQRFPLPPPVIFVTGYGDIATAVEAMKHGAFDYVEKPVSGNQFLDKVQAAFVKSRELHERRMEQSTWDARRALLTPQENRILDSILQGHATKDIATQLDLSVRTVENHRARLMAKLRVNSALELVTLFLRKDK
jgi:FixJ family two-component response regulator